MPKRYAAIMDIESSKITVIIGEQGVNNTFFVRGKGESGYAGFYEGEFLEPENLKLAIALAISNAEKQSGLKIEALFVGVPAEFSFCECTEVENTFKKKIKLNEDDISYLYTEALNREVMKTKTLVSCSSLWYKLDDYRRTFVISNQKTSKFRAKVSLIYVENYFVETMNNILSEIGVESVEYISSCLAETEYLLDKVERDRGAIIIDIGYITTSVCGVLGDGLASLNAFSLGGGHISADFCEAFNLSFAEAEALKEEIILSISSKKVGDYEVNIKNQVLSVPVNSANQIVYERIDMIASLIKRCFRNNSEQNLENAQVYLTGGGLSYITGGRDYLAKCLGREVKILMPNNPACAKPHLSSSFSVLFAALKKQTDAKKGLLKKLFN